MSLRRGPWIVLGTLAVLLGPIGLGQAQPPSPPLPTVQGLAREAGALTRTGARYNVVVAAIERVKGAVVNIHSERNVVSSSSEVYPSPGASNRVNGMGTGIIIDPRGYLVTNHHVVEDVSLLRVKLADGTQTNAVVIARNPEIDLAVLKIDVPHPLPVMPIGTAHDLMIGETVIAIGNAYGYEHSVSLGIVSALKRDVSLNKDMSYKGLIQTDAAINPGNSGGPLVNVNGELVGVNVAIRAGAQCIGFAIPADVMVRTVAEMLRNRRRTVSYDGMACKDVLEPSTDGLARKVVVDRVDPGSPAQTAGLKPGDVVVHAGTATVITSIDVERAFLDRKSGEPVAFVIHRQAEEKKLEVVLAGADRAIQTVAAGDVVWQRLGMQLAPIGADMVTRYNGDLRGGLEVTAVSANGAAARAGIRKGDILVGLHQYETISLENVTYVLNLPELAGAAPVPFYILRSGQVRQGKLGG